MGKQLLDLWPKIADTKRVLQIVGESGMDYELELNPGLAKGYLETRAHDNKIIRKALNPLVGRFDIATKVGPSYDSRQEETADSLTLILTQAPQLIGVLGDLLVKNLPFDGAQEAAMRLRRMVPPAALGEGPTAAEQQAQAQVQGLQTELVKLLNKNAGDKIKLLGKNELRDIEVYRAETERLKVIEDSKQADAQLNAQAASQLSSELHETQLTHIQQLNKEGEENASGEKAEENEAEPPVFPGATKAPDGHHYIPHPGGLGHLRVQEKPPFAGAKLAPDGEFYVPHEGSWAKAVKTEGKAKKKGASRD